MYFSSFPRSQATLVCQRLTGNGSTSLAQSTPSVSTLDTAALQYPHTPLPSPSPPLPLSLHLPLSLSPLLPLSLLLLSVLDLNNATCFGGTFGQMLHYYCLGFETTLINSYRYLMDNDSSRGERPTTQSAWSMTLRYTVTVGLTRLMCVVCRPQVIAIILPYFYFQLP